MKKFKINFKLTTFLVSLFLSLLLVILGSKNNYCLSFGFILMGISLLLFVLYNNEKLQKQLQDINETIDEVDQLEDESSNHDEFSQEEEERLYVLKELYIAQKKINKKQKKSKILFNICGVALIILGFINLL